MLKEITIDTDQAKEILLFDHIKDLKQVNLLFGGNGVGKTTFLKYIKEQYKTYKILEYRNSEDNTRINKHKELKTVKDFTVALNTSKFSEGQAILYNLLTFLKEVESIESEKQIILLFDEIDSGLSSENINVFLWELKELINRKRVQVFIATNSYHFTFVHKTVLDMYTGKFIEIGSYEEYFNLLNQGIQKLSSSNKRNFDFLNIQ